MKRKLVSLSTSRKSSRSNTNLDYKRCWTSRHLSNTFLCGVCLCSCVMIHISKYTHNDLEIPTLNLLPYRGEPLRLRFDYTNLDRLSPVAKEIEVVQNNCSIQKRGHYYHTNGSGLGSELHIYSIVLCTAIEMGNVRFRTVGSWIYNDIQKCKAASERDAPMSCYFPQAEPNCPVDSTTVVEKFDISYKDRYTCPRITDMAGGYSNVRAATTEYLFTRVSDIVQKEGERQLNILFGGKRKVPKNLITVHIRWGDKDGEMKLVPIQNYTNAVQQILEQRKKKRDNRNKDNVTHRFVSKDTSTAKKWNNDGDNDDGDGEVHILLATEDPEAVKQFLLVKPNDWNVYLDQYYTEMLPYRMEMGNVFNVNSFYATYKNIYGRNGLIALGSLLVALEANDFVLTTASNWSRLINELRKNVIDPRCNNCTTMIDLVYDEL